MASLPQPEGTEHGTEKPPITHPELALPLGRLLQAVIAAHGKRVAEATRVPLEQGKPPMQAVAQGMGDADVLKNPPAPGEDIGFTSQFRIRSRAPRE
jgi:hypothetical protein